MSDFPPFRLDRANQCVWQSTPDGGEHRLNLRPRAYDMLQYLVDNAGRLVTHDEFLDALWQKVLVQPEVLKAHMLSIRAALGDDPAHPRFIETHRGRGYRFIAPLQNPLPVNTVNTVDAGKPAHGAFVGRTPQLNKLKALFDEACAGESRVVFVAGEPGIGKTTLVNQFLESLEGRADVLTSLGRCVEGYGGTEPYYPVLEALTQLVRGDAGAAVTRSLISIAPTWAAQLPGSVPERHRAALQRQLVGAVSGRMLREICEFFAALSEQRPLALVFEDLHWSDYSTVDMLSALARQRNHARLMVIATYRPEDAEVVQHPLCRLNRDLGLQKLCHGIVLEPLTEGAIAEYLKGKAQHAREDDLAQLVCERSGGNPLFMVATLDHLVAQGIAQSTPDGWKLHVSASEVRLEVPLTLSQVIEHRIQRLTPEQQRVLEAASVAGLKFDAAVLAPVTQISQECVEETCEALCRQESFIRREAPAPPGRIATARIYAFRHAMYRQTFYERQGTLRTARSHLRIAEELEARSATGERSGIAAELAQHFAAARQWSRALAYLRIAIQTAKKRLAYNDALAILDRAMMLAANLPDNARAAAEVEFLEGRVSIFTAAHDRRARETCEQLAARAAKLGLIDIQSRALLSLAYAYSWRDQLRCSQIIDEALALSEQQTNLQQQARTRISCYVWKMWVRGWHADDIHRCEAALEPLRDGDDPFTTAWSQCEYAMVLMVSARYQMAQDTILANYQFLVDHDENRPEFNMARATWMVNLGVPWTLLYLGDFGRAQQEFDRAIAMFGVNGNRYGADTLTLYRCWLQFHAQDFDAMLASCTQVLAETSSETTGRRSTLPAEQRLGILLKGLAHLGLGDTRAARVHLLDVMQRMDSEPVIFDWYWRLSLEWGLANLALAEDALDEATSHAARLVKLATETEERTWQGLAWETQARVALRSGAATDAVRYIDAALAATQHFDTPLADWRIHGTASDAYNLVGDTKNAAHHAELAATKKTALAASLPAGHRLRETLETGG
ncbi:AAA family ATPase [Paraburkholderia megapolitana]|uniref:Transcriptional regulatory protein, C terminal n=1 Tax=Paraburkholderia megapolitana TaxID=420953 RepID=A0A1I3E1Y3_9BURK|nr:AAA family ATPase [Paraburkholderia megapolitana]QDQ79883.1 AAA family ATPase [Paraburkholderia megapolitana]SFH93000.1 Transcriptional regulatory protein, C terminal [Paraburkholderia megapolitana]